MQLVVPWVLRTDTPNPLKVRERGRLRLPLGERCIDTKKKKVHRLPVHLRVYQLAD